MIRHYPSGVYPVVKRWEFEPPSARGGRRIRPATWRVRLESETAASARPALLSSNGFKNIFLSNVTASLI